MSVRNRTPASGLYATRVRGRLAYVICCLRGHAWGDWIGGWPTHLIEWNRCARCGLARRRRRGLL